MKNSKVCFSLIQVSLFIGVEKKSELNTIFNSLQEITKVLWITMR